MTSNTLHTYLQLWAPSRERVRVARACQHLSHWRRCWRSHLQPERLSLQASDHQVECHVPCSTAPSKHYQSAHQPVQRAPRYTHAVRRKKRGKNRDRVARNNMLYQYKRHALDSGREIPDKFTCWCVGWAAKSINAWWWSRYNYKLQIDLS